jgi:hypothetical protein
MQKKKDSAIMYGLSTLSKKSNILVPRMQSLATRGSILGARKGIPTIKPIAGQHPIVGLNNYSKLSPTTIKSMNASYAAKNPIDALKWKQRSQYTSKANMDAYLKNRTLSTMLRNK